MVDSSESQLENVDKGNGKVEGYLEAIDYYREILKQSPTLDQIKSAQVKLDQAIIQFISRIRAEAGENYVRAITHDLNPASQSLRLAPHFLAKKAVTFEDINVMVGMIHSLMQTVKQREHPQLGIVDVGQVVNYQLAYFRSLSHISGGNVEKVILSKPLAEKKFMAFTQPDFIGRILNNLMRNSYVELEKKFGNQNGGQIKIDSQNLEDKVKLIVWDNGGGFGEYFKKINLEKEESEIELGEIVKLSRGTSGGDLGSGLGLGIVYDLASVINTQVYFKNPRLDKEGAAFSIFLPKA